MHPDANLRYQEALTGPNGQNEDATSSFVRAALIELPCFKALPGVARIRRAVTFTWS